MQEAVPLGQGTMAAILGLSKEEVIKICEQASDAGKVEAANFNCPGQIVVAGEVKAVDKAVELAKQRGAKRAVILAVSAPFHCSLLEPAGQKLARELDKLEIRDPKIPVVSNVNADIAHEASNIKDLLVKQVSSPVLWEDSIRKMIEMGVDTFVELGPGRSLTGFVKKIDKNLVTLSVEDSESLKNTINYFGGKI